MARIARKKRCPTCGTIDMTRLPRFFWMRWFSGSRHYQCRHCRTHILLLGAENQVEGKEDPDPWERSESQLT